VSPREKLVVVVVLAAGCIHASPTIVVVDRATALERQAAGIFPDLERSLTETGIAPRPAPLTQAELSPHGDARSAVEPEDTGAADRIDALGRARCVGEALDGTLVETPTSCTLKDVPRLTRLVDRANRERQQIWQTLALARPNRTAADVRRAWREVHLQAVACGAQVQRADGGWEAKKC
jgi:hypothetical protein